MLKKCFFVTAAAAAALAVAVNNAHAPRDDVQASPDARAQVSVPMTAQGDQAATPAAELSPAAARSALFAKGLHFEPNLGQAPDSIDYVARGLGYGICLQGPSALLTLQRGTHGSNDHLRVRFDGGNADAASAPLAASDGRSNYMSGPEASWIRNVPRYGSVRYTEIYPGVDVVYYGNQRRLEYDCVVAPGADPDQIRIAIDGQESLELTADGGLALALPGGDVVQHAPIAYQEIDGRRDPVAAEYRIEDDGKVGFDLGPYDRTVALVIDPIISYATYLGGSNSERLGADIAVDASGHAYVVGATPSFDFPANFTIRGFGMTRLAKAGSVTPDGGDDDVVVVKFLPDGSDVVYSTRIGGNSDDVGLGIAIDTGGNAYATGWTLSFDYPTAGNPFQRFHGSELQQDGDPIIIGPDAFLSELNATGNGLVYSTYLGGFFTDIGNGVDVDSAGNIYVVGATNSSDFPTNATAARPFYTGGNLPGDGDGDGDGESVDPNEGFVTKFGPSGASVLYSTYITGSTGIETCADVIANDAGEATVVGSTSSFDFLQEQNPEKTANGNGVESFDAFVLRLNSAGSDFVWSSQLGGDGEDRGTGLGIDSDDSVYICGFAGNSTNFPLVNALRSTFAGTPFGPVAPEGFVAKYVEADLDTLQFGVDGIVVSGRSLEYSTFIGGSGDDALFDMDVSASGQATVIGTTTSLDLEGIDAIPDLAPVNNTTMAFLATLTSSGSALTMQTYLGGNDDDWGSGVALGPSGSIFCSGHTRSLDFPVTTGAFQESVGGLIQTSGLTPDGKFGSDYFVVRLDPTPVTASLPGLFIKRIRIRGNGPFGPLVKVTGFVDTGLPLPTLERLLPAPPTLDPPPPFPLVSLNASVQMGPAVFGVPFFFQDTIRVPRNNENFAPLRKKENYRIFFSDLTLQSDPNVFVELKAHRLNLSSRARLRLIFNGDITPAVFPGSNFTVSITTPAFAGESTVTLEDGRNYDHNRGTGSIVTPDFVVRRLKSNLRPRPGGDKFSFVAGFAHDGAPSSAPDLRVAFGSGFDTTVSGSQFQPRGRNRFVFRGNSGGVRFAEIDYERNLIRVFGNGLDLEGFATPPEGRTISVPVQLLIGLDDDVRSVIVLAARAANKIRY